MSIQRFSNDGEDVLKRDCMNLELVLRVPLDLGTGKGSIKVNRTFLEQTGISEDAIWQMAHDNMTAHFVVRNMADVSGLPEEFTPENSFFVCTTDDRSNGAVALAFTEIFQAFCVNNVVDGCWIIPSSTEEVARGADLVSVDLDDTSLLFKEYNTSMVSSSSLKLNDTPFWVDHSSKMV